MIEGHGDDLYLYGGDRVIHNFSSNILQKVDHSGLMAHIASQPDLLSNYPEPAPVSVERKLEEIHGLSSGSVMVTSGATDAIYLIARYFEDRKSWIRKPTFSEYEDACRMFHHTFADLDEADVVWICTPNNPDGRVCSIPEDINENVVAVVDMAYADYSARPVTPPERISTLYLHSLTKRFSVPGLRVGYVVGDPDFIAGLKKLRMPWSVGSVAIAASLYLLDNMELYPIDASSLNAEALRVSAELRKCGVSIGDTDCNFFLATLPCGSAAELKSHLVDRHGILIRDASNITGNSADFRIAVQTREENDLIIKAISEWISSLR